MDTMNLTKDQQHQLEEKGAYVYNENWFNLKNVDYYYDKDNAKGWTFKTKGGFYNQGAFGYDLSDILLKAKQLIKEFEPKRV